ncbi:general transcription factor II-I repeat domain-containing protein 2B-like [Tachypleus tridentatus]|uniref:general transcription factor II-I repeat domain-containing protein 2B-like n=1 Tax=Tachypleus tridentatus TaxID=6853 RepID=UPI003FD0BAA7
MGKSDVDLQRGLLETSPHLNDLNLKLQGRNHMVSDLMGNINGFRSMLRIFKVCLENNDLAHFPICQQLTEQFKDDEPLDFSEFCVNTEDIIDEFNTRFEEFEMLKSRIELFNDPLCVDIENQQADVQPELRHLQAGPFLQTRQEKEPDFIKLLSKNRFQNLRDFGQKMTSMFGSTYICESVLSTMKFIKNRNRSRLTDFSLFHLLRLATAELYLHRHTRFGQCC